MRLPSRAVSLELVLIAAGALLLGGSASATLVGDHIFGALHFGGFSDAWNFFDPLNPAGNAVPAGSSGIQPEAVVSEDDSLFYEFGFEDVFSSIHVDVDGDTIRVEQLPLMGMGLANEWEIELTDLDWGDGHGIAGLAISTSSIDGLETEATGDAVTLRFPGGMLGPNGQSAVLSLSGEGPSHLPNVPEPSGFLVFAAGLTALQLGRPRHRTA
jgi:hypothetical protein